MKVIIKFEDTENLKTCHRDMLKSYIEQSLKMFKIEKITFVETEVKK